MEQHCAPFRIKNGIFHLSFYWPVHLARTLLGAAALAALALIGTIIYDAVNPIQVAIDFTDSTFPGPDGMTLNAYLTQQAGPGLHPAVLLIHEFYGINEDVIRKADLLADQDLYCYGSGRVPRKDYPAGAPAIYLVLSTPQEQVATGVQAAAEYLSHLDGVDPTWVGAVGFCFSGTQVMQFGVASPDLCASVIF